MPLLKEPSVALEGIKIRSVSQESLDLDVAIRVENPNLFGVTLREIPFLILIPDGEHLKEIANGNSGTVSIPAKETSLFTIPVTSRSSDLVMAIAAFVAKGGLDVTIRGVARVDAVIACWSEPFEKTVTVTMAQVAGALNGKL